MTGRPTQQRRSPGRWAAASLLVAGGVLGGAGGAPASASPVDVRSAPCAVVLDLGPGEPAPSTTVPGTCLASSTSGTVLAPPVAAPPEPASPVVDRAERLAVALRAVIHAVRRAMFLGVGPSW